MHSVITELEERPCDIALEKLSSRGVPGLTAPRRSSKLPPAVVAVMSYSGLAVARSLGRKGIRVFGLADSDSEVGMTSRYLTPVVIPNLIRSDADAVNGLLTLSRRIGRRAVIFATGDSIVLPLSRNRETLSRF